MSDFGLVRTFYNDSVVDVRRSQCEGTAPYMSPAVARGEAEDTRCDIYAVGATLYEMLAGRPPYSGRSSAEVIAKVLAGPPAPILKLNPKADLALVKIAEGAMARDLRDRYARAADVAEDLRRVGRREPPLGPYDRGSAAVSRRRALMLAGAAAVPVFAAGTGLARYLLRDRPAGPAGPDSAEGQPPPATLPSTGPTAPLAPDTVRRYAIGDVQGAFSPDCSRFAGTLVDGTDVHLWDTATGGLLWTFRPENARTGFTRVRFAPDGRSLVALCADSTVRVVDARDGRETRRLVGHRNGARSAAFTSDGRYCLTGSGNDDDEAGVSADYALRLWDVAAGETVRLFDGHTGPVDGVAIAPYGLISASASHDRTVCVWDLNTGRGLLTLPGRPGESFHSVAFAPNGGTLLTSGSTGVIRLWAAATGKPLRLFEGHHGGVLGAGFSADGRRVVSASNDGSVRVWDVHTGAQLARFDGHTDWVRVAVFSPDGRSVFSNSKDGTIRQWHVPEPLPPPVLPVSRVFLGHTSRVVRVKFSPDGRLALSGGTGVIQGSAGIDPTIRLWDVATGTELQRPGRTHRPPHFRVPARGEGLPVRQRRRDRPLVGLGHGKGDGTTGFRARTTLARLRLPRRPVRHHRRRRHGPPPVGPQNGGLGRPLHRFARLH